MLILTENFITRGVINRYKVWLAFQSMHWCTNENIAFWPNLYGSVYDYSIVIMSSYTQKNYKPCICFLFEYDIGQIIIPMNRIFEWINHFQRHAKKIVLAAQKYRKNQTFGNYRILFESIDFKINGVEIDCW
jgi:hypothetical protein